MVPTTRLTSNGNMKANSMIAPPCCLFLRMVSRLSATCQNRRGPADGVALHAIRGSRDEIKRRMAPVDGSHWKGLKTHHRNLHDVSALVGGFGDIVAAGGNRQWRTQVHLGGSANNAHRGAVVIHRNRGVTGTGMSAIQVR